ncbi:MAG: hypothetical protein M3405_08970 [Acidobacteriota bacterium]|jgi:hypothetical protein|nr:hypothetical protein [Acidobacteriota bacterium]
MNKLKIKRIHKKNLIAIVPKAVLESTLETQDIQQRVQRNVLTTISKLEYYFRMFPKRFVKHAGKGSQDQECLIGKSWATELDITRSQFKTAFQKVGVCYSDTEFNQLQENGKDIFQGNFYCSVVYPSENNRTYYHRNNLLIEKVVSKYLLKNSKELLATNFNFYIRERTVEV